MAKSQRKRIERLIEVREQQREIVGGEVATARLEREKRRSALEEADRQVVKEMEALGIDLGAPTDPDRLRIALECLQAAKREAEERRRALAEAERRLRKKTNELTEAHRKVQQMEILSATLKKRMEKEMDRKEQRENDDLANTREKRG